MSTRAILLVKTGEEEYKSIYLHFDGDPGYTGKMLLEHYTDPAKVKGLIALGNLSCIKARIDCPPGHTFSTPVRDCTIAYGRDRGESKQKAERHHPVNADQLMSLVRRCDRQNYLYYWSLETGWMLHVGGGNLVELSAVLKER